MPVGLPHIVADKLLAVFSIGFPAMLVMAVVSTVFCLCSSQACNPGKVWWRNGGLVVDVCYCVTLQYIAPYLRMGLVVGIATLCMAFVSAEQLDAYINRGGGPISTYSFWWQAALYLLLSDFLLYWSHRLFHGARLWRYHAIHHSAEDVDWTTAYRFHPVNICFGAYLIDVIMLYLGIAPAVLLALVPFQTMASLFVHANLNWTFGPLKYVVATPVFHRWHHTTPDEGGNRNFASTFALWDVLFGTFHMPLDQLPAHYGVDDPNFPRGFIQQLAFPFTRHESAKDEAGPALNALSSARGSAGPRSES
jgi:sterol desaturase/sphingolipid hydroxylase (fatty acid hydroxylase superfamily)